MGDVLHVLPDYGNRNGIYKDQHCASSNEKNLSRSQCDEGNSYSQQNGYHTEMEPAKAQSGRFNPQIESDAASSDMASLDKEDLNSLSGLEAREFATGADTKECSLLPAKCQERMEDVNIDEASGEAPENISSKRPAENEVQLCPIKEDSNGVRTRECCPMPAISAEGTQEMTVEATDTATFPIILLEAPAVNEDHPCSSDNSHAVLMGDSMEGGDAVSSSTYKDSAVRGDRYLVPCKTLNDTEKPEGYSLDEENDGVGQVVERAVGENAVLSILCNDNTLKSDSRGATYKALDDSEKVEDSFLEQENDGFRQVMEGPEKSVTGLSKHLPVSIKGTSENDMPSSPFHSANESRQHEDGNTNKLGGESEVPSLRNDGHNVTEIEASSSKGEWPDQVSSATTRISTDLEGWQRFDADEVANNFVGNAQGSGKKFEMWEKLLDDGFDTDGGARQNPLRQVTEVHSPFEENQFDLASPGNPFVEGQDRASSFSKADGFPQHIDFPSFGRLPQSVEESSSFRWRDGPFHHATVPAKVDAEWKAAQLEAVTPGGSKPGLQPPASHDRSPLFDAMEPLEAPSFMSLVDPKSHALFEASMPTFQASNSTYAQQGHIGEKWVANFELMAPSTQEITRSSSMPFPGGEASGDWPGETFSFGTGREQEPSKNISASPQGQQTKSGLLSPKYNSMVQKVVDKVRTTPAAANGVLNSVRQVVMSPKASEKEETSKSLLSRCVCW